MSTTTQYPGAWIGVLPILLTAGISLGTLSGAHWPMSAGWVAILLAAVAAHVLGLFQFRRSAAAVHPTMLWLLAWLGWSACGAAWLSPQPGCAWNTWAMDALGCSALLLGQQYARATGDQRWRVPLLSAAVMVLAVAAASFGNGDLAVRTANVWGGMNIGTVTNLMVPILLTAFLIPAMRSSGARWERVLMVCAMITGIGISLLTGRRLALAALLLSSGMAALLWCRSRSMRWALGTGMVLLVLVMAAFAIGVLPGFQQGDALRPLVYSAAWDEFLLHPLTGIGPAGGYTMQEGSSQGARLLTASQGFVIHAHSSLLETLVSGGVIGLALLTIFIWNSFSGTESDEYAAGKIIWAGMLPTILFDTAPGDITGHLWLPFLFGCSFPPATSSSSPGRGSTVLASGFLRCAGLASAVWLLFQAALIARIGHHPTAETQLTALAHIRNPDLTNQILNQVNQAPSGLDEDLKRTALALALQNCGWFVRWPELRWLQRQAVPNTEDLAALAAILRRSPFQDAPYFSLDRLEAAQLTPELTARKELLATLTPDSPGLDGAIVTWRHTIAEALRHPLSSAQQTAYNNLLQQYAEISGIAAVGCWLYARGQLDGDILVPLTSRLQFAISRDGSLILGMMKNLTPAQLARLHELEQHTGLRLPLLNHP